MKIARIKMSPGNVGWYDPLSRIALSQASPEADVFSEMNLSTIRRGLTFGSITLIEGSVSEEDIIVKLIQEEETNKPATMATAEVVESTIAPMSIDEPIVEVVEQDVEEKNTKKSTKKQRK